MTSNESTEAQNTVFEFIVPNLRFIFEYDFQHQMVAYWELPIAVIVVVLNCTMLYIFWKKQLTNVTHILVAAIVMTESIFILLRSIANFSFLGILGYRDFIPFKNCQLFVMTTAYIPSIFQIQSSFLTVAMSTQRCACVLRPLKFTTMFTRKRIILTIICLLLFSCLMVAYDIVFSFPIHVPLNGTSISETSEICAFRRDKEWFSLYLFNKIGNVIFTQILPSVWLVVVDILLVLKLRETNRWREQVTSNVTTQRGRTAKEIKLTIVTILIITVFIMVKTPLAITKMVANYFIVIDPNVQMIKASFVASNILNFCVFLSMPSNFVIYVVLYPECSRYLSQMFRRKRKGSGTD